MEKKNKKKKSIFSKKNVFLFFIISVIILVSFFIFRNNSTITTMFIRNPLMFYTISFLILTTFAPFLNITEAIAFNILLVGLFISIVFPKFFDTMWDIITLPFYIYEHALKIDTKNLIKENTVVSNLITVGDDDNVIQDNIPGQGLAEMYHTRTIATALDMQSETQTDSNVITPGQQYNGPEKVVVDMMVDAVKNTAKVVLPKELVNASYNTRKTISPNYDFLADDPSAYGGSNK